MAWRSCPWTSTAAATAPRPSGPACPASHSPPVPGSRAGRSPSGARPASCWRGGRGAGWGRGRPGGTGGAERGRGRSRSLADVVARTGLSEELLERLIRAGALDSLGRPRRELLWQLREVAGATKGRPIAGPAASRPPTPRLPATAAPDLPPPSELERLGDSCAILSLDARRQVIELFRPALDRLGAVSAARLAAPPPGRGGHGGWGWPRRAPPPR